MILFYKWRPILAAGIAMGCICLSGSCSKQEDPQAEDANIIFQETFDNPESATWPRDSSNGIVTTVRNGWYVVNYTSDDMGTYNLWSPKNIFPTGQKTGSIELVMRHAAGHAQDKAALLFWLADEQNYVAFSIGEKEYRIFQVVSGQTTNIVSATPSTAIRGRLEDENKLRVTLTEEKMLFYINDQKVVELGKEAKSAPDKVGLQVMKASTEVRSSRWEVDYLRVMR